MFICCFLLKFAAKTDVELYIYIHTHIYIYMLKKPPPRAPDGLNLLSGVHPEQKNQQATSVRQSHLHTISRSSKMHIQNSLYFPKDALTTMP